MVVSLADTHARFGRLLELGPPPPASDAAMVSVPLAIVIGLLCSFVQSLGLTMQRKSHLVTARQTTDNMISRSEWRQPLWVSGFIIFLVANIGGTVFQIGALPIVMLAPLGAVSLLYNALLAKFLLHDSLGPKMIGGTFLILIGAVLVGYFGAISEPPHSLPQLLVLFGRPPFVALTTILFMTMICVIAIAHLAEWQLFAHLQAVAKGETPKKKRGKRGHKKHSKLARRWSEPSLAPLDEVSETTSGVATPVLEVRDREGQVAFQAQTDSIQSRMNQDPSNTRSTVRTYGTLTTRGSQRPLVIQPPSPSLSHSTAASGAEYDEAVVTRTKLLLAVAYAGVSGTLSGVCLLLAKSGVELLVLTFAEHLNQFNRPGSWVLLGVMIAAALAQLWYLNKALKMADPTLVCPLAFCFYNTSSIALGLVYFDQVSAISATSLSLVIVGTVVLLVGVFIVSMKPPSADSTSQSHETSNQNLVSSPTSMDSGVVDPESALMANGGGIAGPHLPPSSCSPQDTNDSAAPPQTPPKRRRTSTGTKKVRSASHSGSLAGLGLHLPDFYGRDTLTGYDNPLSPTKQQPRRASQGATRSSSSPSLDNAANTSPLSHQRRISLSLYQSLLNRGLSIGLSPSSPGFHVGFFSPSADGDGDDSDGPRGLDMQSARDLARFQKLRGQRRVYSEADAGGLVATDSNDDNAVAEGTPGDSPARGHCTGRERRHDSSAVDPEDEDEDEGEAPSSSAFRFLVPPLEIRALSDRLHAWWLRNVHGQEDWRERERRRLLEDAD
ncbi:unnamed protein product [Parajaminaea phylloscopi]